LYSPFTIYGELKLSLNALHYFFPLLAVYCAAKRKYAIAALLFGLALYDDLRNISLLSAILLSLHDYKTDLLDKRRLVQFLVISVNTLVILYYVSYLLCNSNWMFLEKSVWRSIFLTYFDPNFGFSWALYTGVFNKYRDFYYASLFFAQISMIYPLYTVLKKYFRSLNETDLGKHSFICGISFAIMYLLGPANTVYDLTVIFLLTYSQYEVIRLIKWVLIWNGGLIFVLILGMHMTDLWYHSLTANASFVFFENFAFGAFYAIIFNEIFTTLNLQTKKNKEKAKGEEEIPDLRQEMTNVTGSGRG